MPQDAPAPAAPTTAMPAPTVVLLLALMLGLQPVTTDLYLPALPTLTDDLGALPAHAQHTLTALLLAFGISQLFWGPLSDRFGRRPVLVSGLLVYVAAALGGALAPTMEVLVVWRVLQGVALGASVMCARAVIRDLYAPAQGARVMSNALSGLGVLGCLSPALGGLLSELFNWRIALLAPAVFGALAFWLILNRFVETVAARNPHALVPSALVHTWLSILRNPTFHAWSALATASYAGLFVFLASSSFVFIRVLGLAKSQYGILMFSMSLCYVGGTFLCRRLLVRLGIRGAAAVAGGLSLCAGSTLGLLGLFGNINAATPRGWWLMLAPMWLFALAHGVHQPCSQSGAVGPFPRAAGVAAALNGFITMAVAWLTGYWLGARMDGTVLPLTSGMWFWSVVIAVVCWTLVRKNGETIVPATR